MDGVNEDNNELVHTVYGGRRRVSGGARTHENTNTSIYEERQSKMVDRVQCMPLLARRGKATALAAGRRRLPQLNQHRGANDH